MVEIKFQQKSPVGETTLDMGCVMLGTDGRAWLCSGSPEAHQLTPVIGEQLAAISGHCGDAWPSAVEAAKSLNDPGAEKPKKARKPKKKKVKA